MAQARPTAPQSTELPVDQCFNGFYSNPDNTAGKAVFRNVLQEHAEKNNLPFRALDSGNNAAALIGNTFISAQTQLAPAAIAFEQVSRDQNKPSWFPQTSARVFHNGGPDYHRLEEDNKYNGSRQSEAHRKANPFPTEYVGSVSAMEASAASLDRKISQIHTEAKPNEYPGMKYASENASQLDAMLSDMRERKLIFQDLKASNIQCRADGSFFISDMKSIYPSEMMLSDAKTNKGIANCTTNAEMPSWWMMKGRHDTSREGMESAFERIHCYQFANILYQMASNQQRLMGVKNWDKPAVDLNPELPMFKTKEGARFFEILQKLSAENPNEQMHYNDAMRLLKHINASDADYANENSKVKLGTQNFPPIRQERKDAENFQKAYADYALASQHRSLAIETRRDLGDIESKNDTAAKAEYMKNLAGRVYNAYANPTSYYDPEKSTPTPKSDMNFKHPIFKGERGEKLKEFISELQKPKPNADRDALAQQFKSINPPAQVTAEPAAVSRKSSTANLFSSLRRSSTKDSLSAKVTKEVEKPAPAPEPQPEPVVKRTAFAEPEVQRPARAPETKPKTPEFPNSSIRRPGR